jgi:mannose-6-phosphate isomerase-like protein (cupin superfamily)
MLALAGPGNPGIAGSDTVPVEHASFHQPVFANADVAVLRNAYPPGGDSGFHAHRRDLLTVIIQPAASTVQRPGQPAVANPRPRAGAVGFGTIGPDPLVHRVVNTDSVPFHIIAVEIRRDRPAGSSLSTRDAQPLYAPILDNARLRAWRLVLQPGQSVPAIVQGGNGVRIVVRGGVLATIRPGEPEQLLVLQPGDFALQQAGSARALRNTGTEVIELVEMELK